MRILVPGAAGFIGYHLCRRLLDEGHEVIGLDSLTTGQQRNVDDLSSRPGFAFQRGDVAGTIGDCGRLDAIYNMAWPASPVDFRDKAVEIMRTCSRGVMNLLELARRQNC